MRRSVKLDGFIDDVPIKVLIHGYIASRYHASIEPIKKAYLNAGNVNLMIVDWSQASYQMYEVSRKLTSQVAIRIAQILDGFLQTNNVDSGLVHLIGHSLGAHVHFHSTSLPFSIEISIFNTILYILIFVFSFF